MNNKIEIHKTETRDSKGIMVLDYLTASTTIMGSLLETSLLTRIPKYEILNRLLVETNYFNRLMEYKYLAGYEFFYLTDIGNKVPEPLPFDADKAKEDRDAYFHSLAGNESIDPNDDERVPSTSDFLISEDLDNQIRVKVTLNDGTVWLSQDQIASVFDKDIRTIRGHITNIYDEGELNKNRTEGKYPVVQKEGEREVTRDIIHYNLDIIISVGYRVNSRRATIFRQWATKVLTERLVKGFSIDKERLMKNQGEYGHELDTTINAIRASERNAFNTLKSILSKSCKIDDENKFIESTLMFYATLKNKLLVATTRMTAAELVSARFSPKKSMFGLKSYLNNPPKVEDMVVGSNYLTKEEAQTLDLLVNTFLHLVKLQITNDKIYSIEHWLEKLNNLILAADRPLLESNGLIKREDIDKYVTDIVSALKSM